MADNGAPALAEATLDDLFGGGRAAYLTLERAALRTLGVEKQVDAQLDELNSAYSHLDVPDYRARTGTWLPVSDMSDQQRREAGLLVHRFGPDGAPLYRDEAGEELEETDYAFVPDGSRPLGPDEVIVVNRTLLQSMPDYWQSQLVRILVGIPSDAALDAGLGRQYQVRAGAWEGDRFTLWHDPIPHYNGGREFLTPRLAY